MTKFMLPYGKTEILLEVPEKNVLSVLKPKFPEPIKEIENQIMHSIKNPINSEKIEKLIDKESKIAIVIDDLTRPLPSKILLPPLLKELKEIGVKKESITIIIATGTHRPQTKDEVKELIGEDIARNYRWINHDCDSKDLVYVGKTSFGNYVYISRHYVESDFKIVISDITPHYYAGYGGVFKSVVPGIAGRDTINFNHSMMFDERANICNLNDNPVFQDLREGALLAGIDFALTVLLNSHKEILKVMAGDPETTFKKGVEFLESFIKIPIEEQADIVISSPGGFPFDINFYQAHKGLFNLEKAVKKHGKILFIAECIDGFGNKIFYEWMKKYDDYREVMSKLKKRFILGAHKAYYVLKTVENYFIDLYTSINEYEVREVLKLNPIKNPQKVVNSYLEENREAKIIIMPYSSETIPYIRKLD